MSDFNVAIIGCGRMGRERARCVHDLGGTIAGVYDVDLNRARSLAAEHNSRIMGTPEEFVNTGVQAVFFCTPPNHRTAVLAAIHAKLPFFVEKPIGPSLAACTPVLQALNSTPVVHSVGYMNRNRASVLYTRALLRRCTVLGISVHLVGKAYGVPWWLDEAASGGPHNEQATHAFDLSRFLIGEMSCVSTTFPEQDTAKRPSLSAASSIRFECGAVGCVFYSCQANTKDIGARIFAAEGSIALSGWDLRMTENTIDGSMPEIQSEDIFVVETGTFMKAVQAGRQDLIACDWADAMRTQATMDASRNCVGVLV
jgi:myo-inositol 2-dehydrogenase / D-chiro-inositol 1-dehydrogenase